MDKKSTRTLGTINARADTLSWLCDERWWPCACMDDNSLKGTKVNVFTFTVQHNNRCCKCVQTRTNVYRETWLHLFARTATDSLQLRTNWSEMHSEWHGTDPYTSGTGCRHIVCRSRAVVLAENKRAESTKVSHLFPPRPPDSGAWLFAFGTPTNACFFPKSPPRKSRIQNVLSSCQWASDHGALRSLFLSLSLSFPAYFFLSLTCFFFFPSPLIRLIREVAERRFEGRDEGKEWWVVRPCHRQLMARALKSQFVWMKSSKLGRVFVNRLEQR